MHLCFQELLYRSLLKSQEAKLQLGQLPSTPIANHFVLPQNNWYAPYQLKYDPYWKVSFEALSNSSPNSSDTTTATAAQNLNSEFVSIYELTKVNGIEGTVKENNVQRAPFLLIAHKWMLP